LGYRQEIAPERRRACERAGVGLVRRVTGGRAVLHGGDLTYAIAAREELLPPGLRATYALVGVALRAVLLELGIDAQAAPDPTITTRSGSFDCFAEPAGDELCVAGCKLVGSAQRRARGGVLQHGSIRLFPDPPALRAAAGLAAGVATSVEELGFAHSPQALAAACVTAFSRPLGAEFARGELDAGERRIASKRVARCRADPLGVPRSSPWGQMGRPLAGPQGSISPADR
jgi:lipoate-protein ligase A